MLNFTLDRVNISNRQATFIITAAAQALGHDLDRILVSRSTIRRSRMATQKSYLTQVLLLLHWGGKLLPDIVQTYAKVDKIAILVSRA